MSHHNNSIDEKRNSAGGGATLTVVATAESNVGSARTAFTPFDPTLRARGDARVVSEDPQLSRDGDALARFILSQANVAPSVFLKCSARHRKRRDEQRGHDVNLTEGTRGSPEGEKTPSNATTMITDFDFTIDVTPWIVSEPSGPPIFLVGDREATYRGADVLQVDQAGALGDLEAAGQGTLGRQWRRRATATEDKRAKSRHAHLEDSGLPPWALLPGELPGMQAGLESQGARHRLHHTVLPTLSSPFEDKAFQPPSKTLREWADEYCSSKKDAKQFDIYKTVYGWDVTALKASVRKTIEENCDDREVLEQTTIEWIVESDVASVRADTWLSRAQSSAFLTILLWISLVYPLFIWPYRRFGHGRGGGVGRWRVVGSAYCLARWLHLDDSVPGETIEEYRHHGGQLSSALGELMETPRGVSSLEGVQEGEWFRLWEKTIADCVRRGHCSNEPIAKPMGKEGEYLDGSEMP